MTKYLNVPSMAGRKRVFDSVFSPASFKAVPPTPSSTPNLGFTSVGHSFGGPNIPPSLLREDISSSSEQVAWDRAWHTATSFLALPTETVPSDLASGDARSLARKWLKTPTLEDAEALHYLLAGSSKSRIIRKDSPGQDLVEWYANEVRGHFLEYTRRLIDHELRTAPENTILHRVVQRLKDALRVYGDRFNHIYSRIDEDERIPVGEKFRRDIHSAVAHSLPPKRTQTLIADVLRREAKIILGLSQLESDPEDRPEEEEDDVMDSRFTASYESWRLAPSSEDEETQAVREARSRLMHFIVAIQQVGLGDNRGHVILAKVMDELMTEFVQLAYSRHWEAPSSAVAHLRLWVQNRFSRLAAQAMNWFKSGEDEAGFFPHHEVEFSHVRNWQEAAIARLGNLRITELFEVIVEWDDSAGAIEDLKHYAHTPSSRAYLTTSFAGVVSQRLLQPGASTLQILQVYISIIRAFKLLDTKGVLLDRVARPVRRYLRDRDDTVKVIVAGLLADVDDSDPTAPATTSEPQAESLLELAVELSKASKSSNQDDDGELDWDDMNWVPDPVDAAPDYKKSKNSDVIGSLISLFESKDVFVKEFQAVMAQRLLKRSFDFDREIRVLELLKLRFGDSALQACEVMLKDVLDSRRVDASIRRDQTLDVANDVGDTSISDDLANKMHLTGPVAAAPQIHAKILSRLFWPPLEEQSFAVPAEIVALQERYEQGFEALKQSRKLTWLNALGSVTVELDLEDRIFKDEVLPYQATVIYAFQTNPNAVAAVASTPVSRTVQDLAHQLSMDPALVLSACLFWLSKRILEQPSPDMFRVLESLPDAGPASQSAAASSLAALPSASAAAAEEAARVAAARATQNKVNEKMKVYWQFILGMLTNQGPMNLQRILMMLNLAVPGGFDSSAEELREFLAVMVKDGRLDLVAGGNYRIAK